MGKDYNFKTEGANLEDLLSKTMNQVARISVEAFREINHDNLCGGDLETIVVSHSTLDDSSLSSFLETEGKLKTPTTAEVILSTEDFAKSLLEKRKSTNPDNREKNKTCVREEHVIFIVKTTLVVSSFKSLQRPLGCLKASFLVQVQHNRRLNL
ncbi:hypothetical protein V6N12_068446 [Hibiscus sabdariffa]|uniref:Uncharacterized protein n=1 Tax=Hibiscus sabdariffa TaxID=183260 RepID=A0ABR2FQ08_9ROSI